MAADRQLWERIQGETGLAYAAFRRFRDLGPRRSLVGARSIERRWSYRWRWAERAAAWDDACWRAEDKRQLAAVGLRPTGWWSSR